MKKLTVLLLILSLLLCGCGASPDESLQPTGAFVDSTGRAVALPPVVETIAVSGPLSQIYILPLAGDKLVGVSNAYTEDAAPYLPGYIWEKTEIGQLYGGKGEMDLEALLAADPDVVIDIGEPKKTTADDLAALTEQTRIPFIHIDATVATAGDAYRTLGKLLNREEKAEELASWCEKTYAMMTAMMERVDAANARKSLLYCLGDKGVNVIAEGSFHAETINMMARNLAVVEEVSFSGDGNQVDLEQILLWDPEYIVFDPASCYDSVGDNAQWQELAAISSGNYFKTPYGPYGWLSSPPAVQRYLGLLWLGELLGVIAVADAIKEDSAQAVKELQGMGIRVVMLTGDNQRTADAIGRQAGVDEVIAGVLPDGKEQVIRKLKLQGKVAMVGDGINDAPALTRADIGIAIGAGTDVAIDAADVVLMHSRLSDVPAAIRLSRATLKNIHENLFWAFFYNVIGIPLAAGLWYPIFGLKLSPMFGAAAMSLSSFCVVTNALRLNLFNLHDAGKDKKIKARKHKEEQPMEKTMKIEGMMCPHCEARVKKTLEALEGVAEAVVSHTAGTAVVTLSAPIDNETLKKAIEDQGYPVLGIE